MTQHQSNRSDSKAILAGQRTAIAAVTLVVYSETGHALHREEPEHFADDLVEFTLG